jgi:hypothetical protein
VVYLMMARDQTHRAVHAELSDRIQNSPVMLFSILGLGGTVFGLLLLGIGIFRSRTGPIWVGPAIGAFLVVEFVGAAFSSYASYLSVLLLGAAFFAIAGLLAPSSRRRSHAHPPSSVARAGPEPDGAPGQLHSTPEGLHPSRTSDLVVAGSRS